MDFYLTFIWNDKVTTSTTLVMHFLSQQMLLKWIADASSGLKCGLWMAEAISIAGRLLALNSSFGGEMSFQLRFLSHA